jgi:hypothetical protein
VGGSYSSTNASIGNTSDATLYETCRWGGFSYLSAVPNGSYTVTLKFAEINFASAGNRIFNVGINGTPVLTNFDIIVQAGGPLKAIDKSFPVTVSNGQIDIQFTAGPANQPLVSAVQIVAGTSTSTSTNPTGTAAFRVNAGGGSYTDSSGNLWSADSNFSGGIISTTNANIANTSDPSLYQSCRWGNFTYQFTVPNGSYTVMLKFAEIDFASVGDRMFNVSINGSPVLTNFDIVAQAGGPLSAVDKSFPVTVTNGQITVQFTTGAANQPLVSAVEIIAPTTVQTASGGFRIDAGGGAYTDSTGNAWSADSDFTGGNTASTSASIGNTADAPLYQSCRWGNAAYQLAVPNGSYTVTLKFAEINFASVGNRLFNVNINGTPVLTNFDIVAQAGGPLRAVDKSFPVTVTNGQITIQFVTGAANQPLISAIQILPTN